MIVARIWNESSSVARRILIELWRRKRSLILWVIFPVSLLIINSVIIADKLGISLMRSFETIAPSALVGASLFFSCLGGTVATIVGEREQSTLKRLFLSPLTGVGYFLGIFLAHAAIAIGQTLVIYGVAAIWGARFQGNILLGGLIILLSIISYVGLGFIFSAQLARRTEDVNSIVAAFGVPLLILGGAFFPTEFFPKSLLPIADINPIFHMNEALMLVSTKGAGIDKVMRHLQFLGVFTMFVLVAAWVCYQGMVRQENKL
jgi:ABC-2 type transport system permease protein